MCPSALFGGEAPATCFEFFDTGVEIVGLERDLVSALVTAPEKRHVIFFK
jgi:hypothetical protein